MSLRRSSFWSRAAVVGVVLVLLAVVFRLVLDPIATRVVRKTLAEPPELHAVFSDLHVSVLPPGIVLQDFKLYEREPESDAERELPLMYVRTFRAEPEVGALLRGELVLRAWVEKPKISYPIRKDVRAEIEDTAERLTPPVEKLLALVKKAPPNRVERADVHGAEILFIDEREPEKPRMWSHDFEVSVENFATHAELSGGRPVTVGLRGRVEKSGTLTAFVTVNPFAEQPEFAGSANLSGLRLPELYEFMKSKAGVAMGKGEFGFVAGFRAEDGRVRGELRPVMKEMELKKAEDGVVHDVMAAVGNVGIAVFGAGEEDRIATRVPFQASLKAQGVDAWTAALGVFRNAFVQSLEVSPATVTRDRPVGGGNTKGRRGGVAR